MKVLPLWHDTNSLLQTDHFYIKYASLVDLVLQQVLLFTLLGNALRFLPITMKLLPPAEEKNYSRPNWCEQTPLSGVEVEVTGHLGVISADVSFSNGVYVQVTPVEDSLRSPVALPPKYEKNARGLPGNFNGDPDDDFLTPDGDSLPANSSSAALREYGQLREQNYGNVIRRF